MARLFALTVLVLLATGVAADDEVPATTEGSGLFEIEVLVFTNTSAAQRLANETSAVPAKDAADPSTQARAAALRTEGLRLGNLRAKLDRLPGHAVLVHYGWVQELQGERAANGVALPTGPASRGLSGTVTAYRGRFLHVVLDLTLPAADGSSDAARLKQSRRVKAGALHYFDNPLFGAIVVVRPAAPTVPTAS